MTASAQEDIPSSPAVRTFLIADIRGYTRFTRERGDEAAARLAAKFAQIVQEGVEAHGGDLVELRGDEALCGFVSARGAVRAAMELQDAFAEEMASDSTLPLLVGMGLDAGEAVPMGEGFRGAALNLAARLCGSARAGQVLASQAVVHLAGVVEGVRYVPLGPVELKGLEHPLEVVAVVGDTPLPPRRRFAPLPPEARGDLPEELRSPTPVRGHERELRVLRWSWRRTRHGWGGMLFVIGPHGAGKTALVGHLAREVHAEGWEAVYAPCSGPPEVALDLIRTAGRLEAPSLIILDDLDRASGSLLDAARALIDSTGDRALLVVATTGEDGEPAAPLMRRVDPRSLRRLHLRPLDASGRPLEPGISLLRGYRLLERVGEGAFGVVWRGIQPGVEREVAVKTIRSELANDPDFIRRFEAEAQVVARLEHPHIVPLHDYWREPGGAYLVMRFFHGGSLRGRLSRGPLEPEEAFRIVEQIGRALTAAHRHGVVHRDVKPSNILLDEEGNAYLSDFGIAASMGRSGPSDPTALRYLSPQAIRGEPPSPSDDLYALGVVVAEMIEEPSSSVTEVIERATADDPLLRFPDALSFSAAFALALGPVPARAEPTIEVRNPFKGLRPFLEADAADFFGREALTRRLVERVGEGRLLAVVGPSGSGKSSVVRAGLIPALRGGALPGSERWFYVDMLPGFRPFEELEAALLRVAVNPPASLIEQLAADEEGLRRAVKRVLPADDSELLLVIDQFEELFTLVEDETSREKLLAGLLAALTDQRSRLRVVVTLRADFYDRPLQYKEFGDLLGSRTQTVTPLSAEEAERAVVGPVERLGVEMEPGLVAHVVADIAEQPGALPLLQYALTELFERREHGVLTVAGYRELGGVSGALARRAEEIFDALSEGSRESTRQLLLRLISLGEGTEDTRRRVLRTELASMELDRPGLDEAIEAFGAARLLSFDRDPISRSPTVELAHEALLREWERLKAWVDEAREDLRTHRRITAAAQEWVESGEDASFLLRGSRLDQAEHWRSATALALTDTERRYLDRSLAQRDAERSEQETRVARERALERRSLLRLRGLVAVMAAAALVASGLTVFAFNQRGRAAREARIAFARELTGAAVASLDANLQRSLLLALEAVKTTYETDGFVLRETEELLHRVVQRRIQTVTGSAGVVFTSDFRVASVSQRFPGTSTVTVVDLTRIRRLFTHILHADDPVAVAFSLDQKLLALGQYSGKVTLWDAATGERRYSLPGKDHPVIALGVSGDGRVLAIGGDPDTSRTWDLAEARELFPLSGHSAPVLSVAFSPDGSRLVSTEVEVGRPPGAGLPPPATGVAKVWEVSSGRELLSLSWDMGSYIVAVSPYEFAGQRPRPAFSPNGELLAIGGPDEAVRVWELSTGRLLFTLPVSSVDVFRVTDLEFSPDGSRLAAASSEGQAKIFEAGSGEELFTIGGHSDRINDLAFSPDGTRLVTAGADGTARLWDLTQGSHLLTLVTDLPLIGASFSPDGTRLATVDGPRVGGERVGGVARVYILRTEDLIALAQKRLTRGFTEEECRTYLHLDRCSAPTS